MPGSYKKVRIQRDEALTRAKKAEEALATELKRQKDEKNTWRSVVVFCGNCKIVQAIKHEPGWEIAKGECLSCHTPGELQYVSVVRADRTWL